jgi:hypothetical protein
MTASGGYTVRWHPITVETAAAGMLRSRHEQSDEHLAPEEVEDVDGNVMLQSVTADWIATAIAASISLSRLPW